MIKTINTDSIENNSSHFVETYMFYFSSISFTLSLKYMKLVEVSFLPLCKLTLFMSFLMSHFCTKKRTGLARVSPFVILDTAILGF